MNLLRYYFSFIQKLIEFVHRKDKGLKILMFHQVNDDKTKWIDSGVSVTKESFEQLIEQLENYKYEFVSISEIENESYRNKIAITFDDVFKDAVQNAFPLLMNKGIPFTVFISEDLVDNEYYISSNDIKSLKDCELCTMGYHANHHVFLRNKTRSNIISEVDPKDFENKYGIRIEHFAYPYGSVYAVGSKAVRAVKDMKYKCAFSTLSYELTSKSYRNSRFFIPRINVCEANVRNICGGE